jgi:hypothetical protein
VSADHFSFIFWHFDYMSPISLSSVAAPEVRLGDRFPPALQKRIGLWGPCSRPALSQTTSTALECWNGCCSSTITPPTCIPFALCEDSPGRSVGLVVTVCASDSHYVFLVSRRQLNLPSSQIFRLSSSTVYTPIPPRIPHHFVASYPFDDLPC